MKVTIYDKNPGPGFMQWCLKTSWLLGCVFQKLIGVVDAYHGVASWAEAKTWLKSRGEPVTVLQYWGHGSPGTVWLAGNPIPTAEWLSLKPLLIPESLVWLRICSAFQGRVGQVFAKQMADGLGCTIGAHTYIIGLFQGGLHTMKPNSMPSWDAAEGTEVKWRPDFQPWLPHSILCLQWWIPKGW